jgi:hypothetical protein
MAEVRNIAGEPRYIPVAGGVVDDGESFEVDDDLFDSLDWHPDLFKVVTPPAKSKPKKTAASGNKE